MADDSFRIRSYRRAAEALEALPDHENVGAGNKERKRLLEVPGIGKGMVANIEEIFSRGQAATARGVAGKVSSYDAGAAEDPGARAEDDRPEAVEHVPSERHQRPGTTGRGKENCASCLG